MSPINTLTLLTRSGALVGGHKPSHDYKWDHSSYSIREVWELRQSTLKVSGRANMLLIYIPPLAFSLTKFLGMGAFPFGFNDRMAVTATALVLHFAKRFFETIFVHKYSSRVSPTLGVFIGIYYALVCSVILGFQAVVGADEYLPWCLGLGATFRDWRNR